MSIETNATRRRFMTGGTYALALAAGGRFTRMANAQAPTLELPIANGRRNLVAYPEKRPLIVLTSRPPQLETPFEVFNEGAITPNDAFFVRYHNAAIPTAIDADKHVIKIGGNAVGKAFELTMADLRTNFKPVEIVAVNQCSGNSRGLFSPRVTGGQLTNGAMGNARWVGVPLKDVLARAELKDSARQVTFDGLDRAVFGSGDFVKALDINHALDGEVMLAYQMNGADIPMLNGYPVKLVVPGYYGTYWVKHLSEIQVIDHVYQGFWMNPAYRIPDNPCACVEPGPRRRRRARSDASTCARSSRLFRTVRACVPASRRPSRALRSTRTGHTRSRLFARWRADLARSETRRRSGALFVSRVHVRLYAGEG